jgi:hypothetical protein
MRRPAAVGETLREARTRRGLGLEDVARRTRIPARLLQALEEERFDQLPGAFYARSYLRQYADCLGLDGAALVEACRDRLPEEAELAFGLEPIAPPRGSPWRPAGVALVGATLLGLLVLAFRPSGGHVPQLPATFRPPAAASAEHAATPPASPPAPAAPTPAPPAEVVLVAARGRCWLLVRSGSERGRVLYEGTLERGEEARFRSRRLWIRLGAPWNVDLLVDGRRRSELEALLAGGRPQNVLVTQAGVREA